MTYTVAMIANKRKRARAAPSMTTIICSVVFISITSIPLFSYIANSLLQVGLKCRPDVVTLQRKINDCLHVGQLVASVVPSTVLGLKRDQALVIVHHANQGIVHV